MSRDPALVGGERRRLLCSLPPRQQPTSISVSVSSSAGTVNGSVALGAHSSAAALTTVNGGITLGDCWRHPAIVTGDATDGLVPLHKLAQWLAYSLIEPLERAGIAVTDLNGLTGLAEYRNGGLFIDTGVLTFRDGAAARGRHSVDSPLVVEWRALTIALLDRLAALVRQRLGRDAEALPLPKILQGGTWAAGRAIAQRLRADGSPPVQVVSDGTVF